VAGCCDHGNERSGCIRRGISWLVEELVAFLRSTLFLEVEHCAIYICSQRTRCVILTPNNQLIDRLK
jgi:hypothetical protein